MPNGVDSLLEMSVDSCSGSAVSQACWQFGLDFCFAC